MDSSRTRPSGSGAQAWLLASVALLTALAWAGWLGWDTQYDIDPVTGNSSGPYQPWQVIGCVVFLLVLSVVASRWLHPLSVTLALSVSLALSFAVSGATSAEADGLWIVGAGMVFVGALFTSAIVATLSHYAWERLRRVHSQR